MQSSAILFLMLGISLSGATAPAKKYYVFKLTKVNWHGAIIDCLSRDLQLATINSAAEQKDVEKAVKDADGLKFNFWISGSDQAEEGSFVWMSTGQSVTFTHWNSGQPDNAKGVEHCMHIRPDPFGTWNDYPCTTKLFYICEDKPGQKVIFDIINIIS